MGTERTIVVAGGGIGGLAVGAGLARAGFPVLIVERAERLVDMGSGLVLSPNGIRAIDAISPELGRRVREQGHVAQPGEARLLMDPSGKVLSEEPIGELGQRYGAPQVSILRSALQSAMLEEAFAAGAEVRTGTAVTGHVATGSCASVLLSDGTEQDADVLIAADGIKSTLRSSLLDDGPPQYRGYTSVRGRTSGSSLYPQAFVASGRGLQLFVAPVGGGNTLYWTAKITAPAGVWPVKDRRTALQDLLSLLTGWHDQIVELIRDADIDDVTVTDIHDRDPDPRWVHDRVALLGDAAHPMVPAMGQGANMALEDAVVLVGALRTHDTPEMALKAYAEERAPRTAKIVLHSRQQGEMDQGASRFRSIIRNGLMRFRGRKDAALAEVVDWRPGLT